MVKRKFSDLLGKKKFLREPYIFGTFIQINELTKVKSWETIWSNAKACLSLCADASWSLLLKKEVKNDFFYLSRQTYLLILLAKVYSKIHIYKGLVVRYYWTWRWNWKVLLMWIFFWNFSRLRGGSKESWQLRKMKLIILNKR